MECLATLLARNQKRRQNLVVPDDGFLSRLSAATISNVGKVNSALRKFIAALLLFARSIIPVSMRFAAQIRASFALIILLTGNARAGSSNAMATNAKVTICDYVGSPCSSQVISVCASEPL